MGDLTLGQGVGLGFGALGAGSSIASTLAGKGAFRDASGQQRRLTDAGLDAATRGQDIAEGLLFQTDPARQRSLSFIQNELFGPPGFDALSSVPVFTGSPEFATRGGVGDPRAFTGQLFKGLLGRDVDAGAVDPFAARLASGDVSGTVQSILASPEYASRGQNSQQTVTNLFRGVLGRDPSPEETRAFLGNGAAPPQYSVTPAERDTLEGQFGRARESVLNTTQPGGLQAKLLNDLQAERARGVTGLESEVSRMNTSDAIARRNAALNLAAQVGFGAPGVAINQANNQSSLFGSAANSYANLANIGASQANQGGGALGSLAGIGTLLALKGGKK